LDLGVRIIEAIGDGRMLPKVKLRRETVQIFGNVAIVHFASARSMISSSGKDTIGGEWMKITHTWMRAGETWEIIGGMAAPLKKEDE